MCCEVAAEYHLGPFFWYSHPVTVQFVLAPERLKTYLQPAITRHPLRRRLGALILSLRSSAGSRSTVKACASNRRDGTLSAPAVLLSDLLIFRWKNHRKVAQKPEGSCQVRARERGSIGTEWGRLPPARDRSPTFGARRFGVR